LASKKGTPKWFWWICSLETEHNEEEEEKELLALMFLPDIFPRIFARHLLRPGGVVLPRVADAVDAEAERHRAEEGVAQETPHLQLEPGPGRGGMGIN